MNLPALALPSSAQAAFRYVSCQIDDSQNAAGYIDVARFVVAGGFQPAQNFVPGAELGLESDSIRSVGDRSSAFYVEKEQRRTKTFALQTVPESEAFTAFGMQRIAGTARQVFLVTNPDDTTNLHHRSFLGVLRRPGGIQYQSKDMTQIDMSWEVVEEL
jgi:hypothetical protein